MKALVLEGGGAKGSYEVGCMLALKDLNIKCDVVVGSSIGAVNGAFYASNQLDVLEKLWLNLEPKEFLDVQNPKKKDLKIFDYLYIIDKLVDLKKPNIDKLRNLIKNNLDIDKLLKSNIDYGLVTYNLTIKRKLSLFKEKMNKNNVIDYIIASAYFPIFKFEKIIDNSYYIDGGLYDNLPIEMVNKYDEIIVIRTNRKKYKYKKNIIEIQPLINLGNTIYFNKRQIKRNIKLGYHDTMKKFKH